MSVPGVVLDPDDAVEPIAGDVPVLITSQIDELMAGSWRITFLRLSIISGVEDDAVLVSVALSISVAARVVTIGVAEP